MAQQGWVDLTTLIIGTPGSKTRAQLDAALTALISAGHTAESKLTEFRRRLAELDPAGTSAPLFEQAWLEEDRAGRVGGQHRRGPPPAYTARSRPVTVTRYATVQSPTPISDYSQPAPGLPWRFP